MCDSSSYTLIYLALTYLIFPPGVLQVVKGGGTFGLPPPAPHLWIGSIVYELCREKCDQTTLHQSGSAPELRGSTIPPPRVFLGGLSEGGAPLFPENDYYPLLATSKIFAYNSWQTEDKEDESPVCKSVPLVIIR